MAYASDVDLFHLQRALVEHFALEEMDELCFLLKIDFEEIAGETKSKKARELVKFCYRMGRVDDLVRGCAELRPQVDWVQPGRVYDAGSLPEEWVEPVQRLYGLAREFNQNRRMRLSVERTRQGDEIAFTMREAAPFLFGQMDVDAWLGSPSAGKRLAAVKYLDWLQDAAYAGRLLGMLLTERPFLQLHVLLALDRMQDQLSGVRRWWAAALLWMYGLAAGDGDRAFWRRRVLRGLTAD